VYRKFLLLFILVCSLFSAQAQPPAPNTDSASRVINILNSLRIFVSQKDSLRYIVGDVVIRQGTTLFKADSVVQNERQRYIEAFGRIYINESDSVITTARYLKYYLDTRQAILKQDVRIKTANGNFNAPSVEYDLANKVAVYKEGAQIYSKKSTLTSRTGQYYTNTKDALFTGNVILKGPEYNTYTDTLYYNVNTELATFVTYTKVVNKKKQQTIETTRGFYDMKRGVASFTERSVIRDSSRVIVGEKIDSDEKSRTLQITQGYIRDTAKGQYIAGINIALDDKNRFLEVRGNGIYKDTIEGFVLTGNTILADENSGRSLATGKPVAIIKQEEDSIYIAADTLYSGRIEAGLNQKSYGS
jgi:lipopolysaccharide export system protein LptA